MSGSADGATQESDATEDSATDTTEINFLDLPDDQVDDAMFAAMTGKTPDSTGDASAGTLTQDDIEDGDGEGESTDGEGENDDDSGSEDADDSSDAGGDDDSSDSDSEDAGEDDTSGDDGEGEDDGDESDDGKKEDLTKDEQVITEALKDLEKILSPFKANGTEVQVDSVEDAMTLMQMGANYNKKMSALKPNLKFVKMLQQNDLLDEGRLTQLIDISKKNPQAIARFLKESQIDPETVTADEAGEDYTPGEYGVNDSEVELDLVLDGIRGNESFTRTVDVVSNQWDPDSKAIIFKNPNIITVIDSHIQSGVFDKIKSRMETEKMLGKLDGIADVVAYKKIGDQMDAAGLLGTPQKSTEPGKKKPTKQAAKPVDKARNDKRRAAGGTKQAASKAKADVNKLNPLNMSDEDFEKAAQNII